MAKDSDAYGTPAMAILICCGVTGERCGQQSEEELKTIDGHNLTQTSDLDHPIFKRKSLTDFFVLRNQGMDEGEWVGRHQND